MPNTENKNESKINRQELLTQFSILLNELGAKVELQATSSGVSATLKFDTATIEQKTIRQLATLLADAAV